MNKYETLRQLALTIHEAACKANVDPSSIAVKLPNDYWMDFRMDFRPNDGFAEYHPDSDRPRFTVCNIEFYNDRSMPDWMKSATNR